jgi:beta-phosphoglucomutase
MEPSDYCAVIWDVDGTLVDTAELHFQAWTDLCRMLNLPFTREDFATTFGRRNAEIIPQLFGRYRTPAEISDLSERKEELYRAAARRGVTLLPGAARLLSDLHAVGFKQAIGSSAPLANIELILSLTHSAHFFEAVSSAEDTQRGKPDPQVFQVAAAKLGIPADRCVVMEDAVAGVEAARAGGMKCIAVRFVGHHPAAALTAAGADLVVDSLEDVSVETIRKVLNRS